MPETADIRRGILPRRSFFTALKSNCKPWPTISANGWFCAKAVLKRMLGCLSARLTVMSLLIVSPSGRAEPAVLTHTILFISSFIYQNPTRSTIFNQFWCLIVSMLKPQSLKVQQLDSKLHVRDKKSRFPDDVYSNQPMYDSFKFLRLPINCFQSMRSMKDSMNLNELTNTCRSQLLIPHGHSGVQFQDQDISVRFKFKSNIYKKSVWWSVRILLYFWLWYNNTRLARGPRIGKAQTYSCSV